MFALEDEVSGSEAENRYYPDVKNYAWIKKLAVRDDVNLDFFWGAEFMQHVCSRRFMDAAQRARLKGMNFIPLDERFVYDPWGDIS